MNPLVRGKKLCMNVKRYRIKDIPESDEEVMDWIMKMYQRKEKLLSELALVKHTKKRFPGEAILHEPFKLVNWMTEPFRKQEEMLLNKKQS